MPSTQSYVQIIEYIPSDSQRERGNFKENSIFRMWAIALKLKQSKIENVIDF